MVTLISFVLTLFAVVLAIAVLIFFVEVVAAIALPQPNYPSPRSKNSHLRVAVLVPAHDEGSVLLPTLADIKRQMRVGDRLIVIADNCSDDTAIVAKTAGAEVISRDDPERKGKGYALAWGLRHLALEPPDVVIVIDADCRVPDSALDQLAATCAATDRPVQSLSAMVTRSESPINSRVAEFAWHVKNYVRPSGLAKLGLPCQLMGTGMAFPWNLINTVDLASGSIVEDLKLGLDLARAGSPPFYCPFPGVISDFPFTVEGATSQRLRWEHGHIKTILTTVPGLLIVAVARADFNLAILALDAAVPPLSLLGLLVIGMLGIAGLATLLGISATAMLVSLSSFFALMAAVFFSWLRYGQGILPPRSTLSIIPYVFGKFPLYGKILLRKSSSQWVRTDRGKL